MNRLDANSLRRFAPPVAALVILGVLIHAPFAVRAHPGAEAYMQAVRAEAERLPYKIGPWLGRDVDVAPAAVQLLRPNVLMQRQYANMETGVDVTVLFVHCGDARDMQGHYPPICYPAHGWIAQTIEDVAVEVGNSSLPARRYHFSRETDGVTSEMTLINFFAMPSGEAQVHREISAVNRASQDASAAGLGAAQVQIVSTNPNIDLLADGVASQLLDGLEPLLRTITAGVKNGDD